MKSVIELRKLFFACMVVGSTVVLSSCSDDEDDKTPTPPSVTDVNGDYSGKMFMNPIKETETFAENEPVGTDVTATVKSDTVYFSDFPVTDLVTSIVGPDLAPAIIEQLGKVSYKVGYEATLNAAQDSIYMVYDPQPLKLEYLPAEDSDPIKVEVTVTASEKGSYELSSKKLNFDLNADKVTVAGIDFDKFVPTEFTFELNKE